MAKELFDLEKLMRSLAQDYPGREIIVVGGGIKSGRRVGNTTRQADNAIQHLFSGAVVIVRDHHHYYDKECIESSKRLLQLITSRLTFEHKHVEYILDKNNIFITLKNK